jgi:tRNA dimethylallyltransferase
VALAERCGAEIVSADSQQVYRHFDLGTAKPNAEDLHRVPHHLVSVVDPGATFSAARFQTMADQAIEEIAARGRRVVVAGGTGLYLRILLHGVVAAPGADPVLRARLQSEIGVQGAEALHRRLAEVDPATARAVAPRDAVRIVRALEIYESTGRRASEQRSAHAFSGERYPYQLFVLDPPREALYTAIDTRTRGLFAGGLIDETRRLCERGFRDTAPMRSVGYVQALAVIEGRMTEEQAIAQTAQATRQYAKRQVTWFRKERDARWVKPPYEDILAA